MISDVGPNRRWAAGWLLSVLLLIIGSAAAPAAADPETLRVARADVSQGVADVVVTVPPMAERRQLTGADVQARLGARPQPVSVSPLPAGAVDLAVLLDTSLTQPELDLALAGLADLLRGLPDSATVLLLAGGLPGSLLSPVQALAALAQVRPAGAALSVDRLTASLDLLAGRPANRRPVLLALGRGWPAGPTDRRLWARLSDDRVSVHAVLLPRAGYDALSDIAAVGHGTAQTVPATGLIAALDSVGNELHRQYIIRTVVGLTPQVLTLQLSAPFQGAAAVVRLAPPAAPGPATTGATVARHRAGVTSRPVVLLLVATLLVVGLAAAVLLARRRPAGWALGRLQDRSRFVLPAALSVLLALSLAGWMWPRHQPLGAVAAVQVPLAHDYPCPAPSGTDANTQTGPVDAGGALLSQGAASSLDPGSDGASLEGADPGGASEDAPDAPATDLPAGGSATDGFTPPSPCP